MRAIVTLQIKIPPSVDEEKASGYMVVCLEKDLQNIVVGYTHSEKMQK